MVPEVKEQEIVRVPCILGDVDHVDVNAAFNIALCQYDMVNRYQKEMMARGTLISPNVLLAEGWATLEPTAFRR